MNPVEHMRLLLAYDGWATDRLLEQTSGLVEEPATQGASWGSIEGSIRHVLVSHATWLERVTHDRRPVIEGPGFATLTAGARATHQALADFAGRLSVADVYQEVHFNDSRGLPHHDSLGVLLSHLVNHGTYHRGEAALLLTRLGRSPGDLDLVVYRRITEPGR